jgi:hypothetical protein
VASQLFWLIATVDIAVSIGFELLMRRVPNVKLTADHFGLARSQRKDNWLACAVIWAVVLSDSSPLRKAIWVMGALLLTWLIQRTAYRLRRVMSQP